MNPTDDFYIGYQPQAPKPLAQWLRRAVAGIAVIGLGAIGVAAIVQSRFARSNFEFGVNRTVDGTLLETPYPRIERAEGTLLLVAPGKHGAEGLIAGGSGKAVQLTGARIARGDQAMLEIVPGSLRVTSEALPGSLVQPAGGLMRLTGEIVDSKCFLGVMNPGEGKVHRDCAARCISGGIPPGFQVVDAEGRSRMLLLTNYDRKAIVRCVAEPVTIAGRISRRGSQWEFQVEGEVCQPVKQ